MPDCHKCPHDGKRHKTCLRCPGPSSGQKKGKLTISLDAQDAVDDQSLGLVLATCKHVAFQSREQNEDSLTDFARFVHQLFTADDKTWRILRYRYLHPQTPLARIARKYGVSTQSIHQRLQHFAETFPAVRDLVNLKLKRQ